METELLVELPVNGNRNAVVKASGILSGDLPRQLLVAFSELNFQERETKKLKIESLTFAIQEKLGFRLWWRIGEKARLILPLESRGYLNWASIYSLHSPEGADGILIDSFGWAAPSKVFTFMMDLEKQ